MADNNEVSEVSHSVEPISDKNEPKVDTDVPTSELVLKTKAVVKINNFTERIKSMIFSDVIAIGSDQWIACISVGKNDCVFELILTESTDKTIVANFVVKFLDKDNETFDKFINRKVFRPKAEISMKIRDFTTRLDQMDKYFPNNTLTIVIKITYSKASNNGHKQRFCFQNSFLNKDLSDCRLVVRNEELFASKAILSDRSEVFALMFTTDMLEKTTCDVIIDDIDPKVFKEFLRFVYFGDSNKLTKMAEELLYVSDKYMVWDLKKICENLVYLTIHPKNAFKVLDLMNKYGSNELMAKTIQYIKDNGLQCLENEWHKIVGNDNQLISQLITGTKPKSKMWVKTMSYTYCVSK